ncbi:RNA polymerase II elongation factor ELL3 [Rhinophrynus dorsalis]
MSRSGEELVGTLSYRTEPRKNPRLSLFHLKLTDSALRCLRDFQRGQGSGVSLPQPVITFQGNQGYIKIPSPVHGSDHRARIFAFYLSRESKDKPQSSFECIRQSTSWSGDKQLSCIGSIQDKITVCATDESYQLTRDRMSQVEKETWSRTAIEIKPGASHRSKCVKIPSKNSMEQSKESSPCSRRPPVFLTPAAKKCSRVGGENRPLQEWLIHLLALKPLRKQDLIQRLEKSNAVPRDQTELQSILDMVGRLNSKDGSYNLREELYCQVQKDWIAYTTEEKQHMAGILSRRHANNSLLRNSQTAPALHQRTQHGPPSNGRGKPADPKRPAHTGSEETESYKRVKTSHLESCEQHSNCPSILNVNSQHQVSLEKCKSPHSVTDNHNAFPLKTHKNQNNHRSLVKSQHQEANNVTKPCGVQETDKDKLRQAPSQRSQVHKRPDYHKDEKREQDSSEEEDEEEEDWDKQALLLERCLSHPEEKPQLEGPASPPDDIPDYFKKYSTITSEDQRQVYEKDFASDYSEYLELHAKIGKVLERFVQLGSKMKKLQPGTVEHKMIENKILAEYEKFKKTYPGYREEKTRCEYLHHKLSHIKHLILEYEKNTPT